MEQSIRVIAACDPFSRNITVEEHFVPYLRKLDCCMMAITDDSFGRIGSSICSSIASCLVGFDHHQYANGASIVEGTAFVAAIESVVMAASDTH